MEPVFYEGFLEEEASVRFSDFTEGGWLEHSKCLMYFERSRFRISELSGIDTILTAQNQDNPPVFVVTKVEIDYLKPVRIVEGDFSRKLVVRTRLVEPVISKLQFEHRLLDASSGDLLIRAMIDTAVLVRGRMLLHFSQEVQECLTKYLNLAKGGKI